jgi:hypothetical protein
MTSWATPGTTTRGQATTIRRWLNTTGNYIETYARQVSGNDKVWRKFTFPAVTTDRMKVYVTGGDAGRSRIVEVEAAFGADIDYAMLIKIYGRI